MSHRTVRDAPCRPLEEDWRHVLAAVARAKGLDAPPKAMAARVRALSDAYNHGAEPPTGSAALSARLAFGFPRDVPKSACAVRELVAAGRLALEPGRPLRVLDLGAGLGATTWGVARALAAAGDSGEVDALLVDHDAGALALAESIAAERRGEGGVAVRVRVARGPVQRRGGPFDLVLLGQVLCEMGRDRVDEDRVAEHAALLDALADELAPSGSLVVVEPALRPATRHLHAVRDRVLSAGKSRVFAPCLHQTACPALATSDDWCHEDLPVDLPEWLAPLARGAGLRWQGLTFSYVVLRRDGATLRDALGERPRPLRVTSRPLRSKGKSELFLCGELEQDGEAAWGRPRVARLDRHRVRGDAWEEAARGDLLGIEPPLAPGAARVEQGARIVRLEPRPPPRRD